MLIETENAELKGGHFYWVLPNFDVDVNDWYPGEGSTAEAVIDHWSNRVQPAMYIGHGHWRYLGQDDNENPDDAWGVRWVGPELVPPR